MKSRRLTFYLLREDIADFDDALDPDKPSVPVEIDPSTGIDGRFFYVKPQSSVPTWVGFVQPLLTDQLSGIRSASTSALLLLRTSGRIFALTFGYGRSFARPLEDRVPIRSTRRAQSPAKIGRASCRERV